MQIPLFKPTSTWVAPKLGDLPSWDNARRVCIDIETHDPDIKELGPGPRRNGFIAGIGFALEDGPAHYLPIRHAEDNLPREAVLSYFKDQAKTFAGDIVGANLNYDLDYLVEAGIFFHKASYRDVQIADPLIYELHESYSLQNIALRFGLSGKDETLLRDAAEWYDADPKRGMALIPGRFVAPYALQDVRLPLQILRLQERELEKNNLTRIWGLECEVLPVLAKMRNRGVAVNQSRLEQIEQWSLQEEGKALAEVHRMTGITVPVGAVWANKIINSVLSSIGVKPGRTATGKPKIDADFLDTIDHPVAEHLAWARKVNKLRTTFAKSIRQHLTRGRIHCIFNQLAREGDDGQGVKGARYGRLSCEHPNFQQQPARDEFAKQWRSIYVPDDGGLWASADYSQQEPRMTTHYAVKSRCTRANVAAERYRNDPLTDNHQMMAELTGLPRKQAKNLYLGMCYGMGGAKLCDELGLPTKIIERNGRNIRVAGDEGQAVIDKFNSHAPFIRELARKCTDLASRRGFIVTLLGRRCHFPKDPEGNFDWTHKALNRLIQGSSADQTKAAMVAVDKAGYRLQLQVHDELDLTVVSREEAEGVAECMRTCVDLEVPSQVDVEVGPSWGEVE
jgi:DNA polymerase I-like protein with 3'-5' exonuclease and polymerase domains